MKATLEPPSSFLLRISRHIKAFSIWYIKMLLLFRVCPFLLWVCRVERSLPFCAWRRDSAYPGKDWLGWLWLHEANCPLARATGVQVQCLSLASFFSCPFPCLPDRVQSLWIEDTWLARTNDEQQHELWVWVPPNKWEEVLVCQVSPTSKP